jgi:hypothetical protein
MNKKIYFAIGVGIVIIGIIIILIYQNQKNSNTITNQVKISKVINDHVFNPIINNTKNRIIFFNSENGNYFYELNLANLQKNKISNLLDAAPNSVIWSPTYENAIISIIYNKYYKGIFEIPNVANNITAYWDYNLKNNTAHKLITGTSISPWSPDGNTFAYAYYDPTLKTDVINLADKNGSFIKKIAKVNFDEGINCGFINSSEIYYSPIPTETNGSNIYLVNINTGVVQPLITDNSAGSTLIQTPDKTKFIYASYQNNQYVLGTMNLDGSNKKTFNSQIDINRTVTLLENQNIITTIAQTNNKNYDNFYKINISTGATTLLFQSYNKENYSASNLMVSSDGKSIYFTSNNYLYKMNL